MRPDLRKSPSPKVPLGQLGIVRESGFVFFGAATAFPAKTVSDKEVTTIGDAQSVGSFVKFSSIALFPLATFDPLTVPAAYCPLPTAYCRLPNAY
jgi:hypothetical protein